MIEFLVALGVNVSSAAVILWTGPRIARRVAGRAGGAVEEAEPPGEVEFIPVGTAEQAKRRRPGGSTVRLVGMVALIGAVIGSILVALGWAIVILLQKVAGVRGGGG